MRIIDKVHKKIKRISALPWIDELMWIAIIMCVALGSFSLGILYEKKQYLQENPIEVTYSSEGLKLWEDYQNINQQNQNFFASKNGLIVYPIDCSAGNRVKEENRVYFNTLEQGLTEGYRESDSC